MRGTVLPGPLCGAAWALVVTLAAAGPQPALDGLSPCPLRAGDRVAFLGDSITQAATAPGGFIDIVSNALHAAGADVPLLGAGHSGNRVNDLQARLDVDVLAWHPTVVVVSIGVNDIWLADHGLGTPPEAFDAGLRDLATRCRAAGARVVFCTPALIGEKTHGGNRFDAVLDDFSARMRRVAAEFQAPVVDWRGLFVERLRSVGTEGSDRGVLTNDGVHPNAAGNRLIAEGLLDVFGVKAP